MTLPLLVQMSKLDCKYQSTLNRRGGGYASPVKQVLCFLSLNSCSGGHSSLAMNGLDVPIYLDRKTPETPLLLRP